MHDKVTIAIPTLNRAEYLRIALDSALAQSYSNLEVVVSNNACSDHTTSVLKSMSDPRLNILEQEHTLGMMENWNACLRAASGKYFLLLSDDDVLEPNAIEEMVNAFEDSERQEKKLGFVYCNGMMIDKDGKTVSLGKEMPPVQSAREIILAFFDGEITLAPCAILFRREDLAPGYDVRFYMTADAAQWIRIVATHGSARFVNRRLARYRLHRNATAQMRIAMRHKLQIALGEFAINELQRRGEPGDDISQEIRKSVHRVNVLITPDHINQSFRHDRLGGLGEYWQNRRIFTSWLGVIELMKGLSRLMPPAFLRKWVRRRLYPTDNL